MQTLKNEGIFYWDLNLKLLDEIKQLELEESYKNYIDKLYAYTELRQETYTLILKALQDDTDKYNSDIEQKNRSVESILNEIEQMTL